MVRVRRRTGPWFARQPFGRREGRDRALRRLCCNSKASVPVLSSTRDGFPSPWCLPTTRMSSGLARWHGRRVERHNAIWSERWGRFLGAVPPPRWRRGVPLDGEWRGTVRVVPAGGGVRGFAAAGGGAERSAPSELDSGCAGAGIGAPGDARAVRVVARSLAAAAARTGGGGCCWRPNACRRYSAR